MMKKLTLVFLLVNCFVVAHSQDTPIAATPSGDIIKPDTTRQIIKAGSHSRTKITVNFLDSEYFSDDLKCKRPNRLNDVEVKDGVLSAIGSDGRHYQIFMNPTKGPITLTDWIAPGVEVSLLTTPIKVRPAVDSTLQTTQFGLSNAGIYVGWRVVDRRYYFWNGGSRTYQIGIGGFLAPSVETLKTSNTASFTQADTQQLFISTGLAIPIRYNAASFVIVPLGFDYGISPESRRYRYHGRWWWGFGFSVTFTELIGP